jgi:hypothetical protein
LAAATILAPSPRRALGFLDDGCGTLLGIGDQLAGSALVCASSLAIACWRGQLGLGLVGSGQAVGDLRGTLVERLAIGGHTTSS